MFKFHRGELPDVFSGFFTYNRDVHDHFTRQSKKLHPPQPKSEISRRSLAYWGTIVWNSILSTEISIAVQPDTFKHSLKELLFADMI